MNLPERLVIPVPDGVSEGDAACAPIAFSTVQHMLFDNAKLPARPCWCMPAVPASARSRS